MQQLEVELRKLELQNLNQSYNKEQGRGSEGLRRTPTSTSTCSLSCSSRYAVTMMMNMINCRNKKENETNGHEVPLVEVETSKASTEEGVGRVVFDEHEEVNVDVTEDPHKQVCATQGELRELLENRSDLHKEKLLEEPTTKVPGRPR